MVSLERKVGIKKVSVILSIVIKTEPEEQRDDLHRTSEIH